MQKGMVSKILLAGIIIGVAGIFALPATVAMFSGQHMWYATDVTSGGSEIGVPCEKCHPDIAGEYQDAFLHPLYAPHKTYPCSHCHRISGFGENNGTGTTDWDGRRLGNQTHAAVTLQCMDCHDLNYMFGRPPPPAPDHHMHNPEYATCGWGGPPERGPRNCHAPPRTGDNIAQIRAGGFGLTDFDNMSTYYYWKTWPEDTGEEAAHREFVLDALADDTLEGANEACIACHTESRAEIEFTVPTGMKITVHNTYTQTQSHWDIINIEPISYTTYREVKGG